MMIKKRIAFLAIFLIFGLSTWALADQGDTSGSVSSAASPSSSDSSMEGEGTADPFSDSGWLLLTGAAAGGFAIAVFLQIRRKKAGK